MTDKNPYNGKLNHWYETIGDWLIANPGRPIYELALEIGKHQNTISYIINSDTFKEYFAQRRAKFREAHDHAIINKTAKIAELGLDIMLESMEKKRQSIPLTMLNEVTGSALERLGYGTKSVPQVQVNNFSQDNRSVTHATVSVSGLEEAKMMLRAVEESRARGTALPKPEQEALTPPQPDTSDSDAEDGDDAPILREP